VQKLTPVRPALRHALGADVIRDVCGRPAVLLALGEAVPAAAVTCAADRRRAVADGVARALELALALAGGVEPGRAEAPLLEEAEQRMWEPLAGELAHLLQRTGPDGLFAYLVVEGAVRREAWRADTQRRRRARPEPLPETAVTHVERDPVDVARFRLDVEQVVQATAARTGLSDELVYGLLVDEISCAEAGRRSGRSANGIWMALARLRPEWQGLAGRGRAAGLGGGILVRVTDRTEVAVRRAIRWRLVGGTAAGLLLAGAIGAALAASWLEGAAPTARTPSEPALETSAPVTEGPSGPLGRLLALEAAARLARGGAAGGTDAGAPDRPPVRTSPPDSGGRPATTGDSRPAGAQAVGSCGLGSAALACR